MYMAKQFGQYAVYKTLVCVLSCLLLYNNVYNHVVWAYHIYVSEYVCVTKKCWFCLLQAINHHHSMSTACFLKLYVTTDVISA